MSDLLGIGTTFGAGLSFIGGLAANAVNKQIANQNIAYQREANEANLSYLREANAQNIAFQQKENDITRAREDNAVQRAAADMQAAGLSKTLSAGNPASAAALNAPSVKAGSVQALNNQFKYESALQKMNLGSLFLDMAAKKQQLEINQSVADAQIRSMNAQTAGQELSNSTYMEEFNMNKDFKFAQTHYQTVQANKVEAETDLIKTQGEYAAQKITAEINLLTAQRVTEISKNKLNLSNIQKAAQEIAESVARTQNLDKQGQKLAYEITYADLQNQVLQHNLSYAEENNLPVGSTLNGTWGSLYNLLNTILSNSEHGSGIFGLVDSGVPRDSGGGYAW